LVWALWEVYVRDQLVIVGPTGVAIHLARECNDSGLKIFADCTDLFASKLGSHRFCVLPQTLG